MIEKLADKLRRANARARGADPAHLLKWSQLKQSEQNQWLDFAAACQGEGIVLA